MEGKKVLDLGANIGAFTRRALEEGARVVAVEMDAGNFSLLKQNTTKAALHSDNAAGATRLRCAVVAHASGSVQAFSKAEGRAASKQSNQELAAQRRCQPVQPHGPHP
eukprot:UN4614